MSKEELFKKYQEIILKTNGGADDYIVALCQISDLIKDYAEEKDQQITDLQKQLAECEKSKEAYRLQNEQHHLQLLQFYSRLGVEAFGADIHEKALETLMIMKEQLAEKDKEISEVLAKQSITCLNTIEKANQDKISFALEQLEKVKKLCKTKFEWWENSEWEGNIYDKSDVSNAYFDIEANIDEQIKAIKEEK